ncbi:Transcriptional activator NphR [bacterium YEK0313]|nr:Transcriptional activator NphR [bacterium YEK0313]
MVRAGECIAIPAGLPHRSLPHDAAATNCLNIYAPLDFGEPAVLAVPDALDAARRADGATLLALLARRLGRTEQARAFGCAQPADWQLPTGRLTIGRIAAASGISREEFSRRFARTTGLPPHAYRIIRRLNEARRRLRGSEPLAAVAAELGFADQSHFGRQFVRVFGVSPAAYRTGRPPSQMIQTAPPS